MIYDIYAAYNCPVDRVIYIFYDIVTKVNCFDLLIINVFRMNKKMTLNQSMKKLKIK